jgi:hypothetical protein
VPVARPPTEADRYREVVRRFKRQLAALYRDPEEARRTFAATAFIEGRAKAVRLLEVSPQDYGELRSVVLPGQAAQAVQWGALYAQWNVGRPREAARLVARLYRGADRVEQADHAVREAGHAVWEAKGERKRLDGLRAGADDAERWTLGRSPREIYVNPSAALARIDDYRGAFGVEETALAIAKNPARFGALQGERYARNAFIRDTRAAREGAGRFAWEWSRMQHAARARPTAADVTGVNEAVRATRARLDAAQEARSALPPEQPYKHRDMAARIVQGAVGRGGEASSRFLWTLAPMLTRASAELARKAMEPERDRSRERGRGIDF